MATAPWQSQLLHTLILLLAAWPLWLVQLAAIAEPQHEVLPITLPGCPDKCGDISIPFPFGMKPGCFRKGFQVTCNTSFQPPRAFLAYGVGEPAQMTMDFLLSKQSPILPVELIDVSVAESEARAYGAVASVCNNTSGAASDGVSRMAYTTSALGMDGPEGPFLVSPARNVLVGVGAEVEAKLYRFNQSLHLQYLVSCNSMLVGGLQLASDGSCSGRGCCQASLPEAAPPLTGVAVLIPDINVNQALLNSSWAITNPCSFAMVVESSWYNFSTADLYGDTSNRFPRGVPYVMDFAVRNASCPAKGHQPPPDYACVSGNSSCADVTNGYVCKCLEQYDGNPYIPNGCQDINECKRPDLYPCSSDGICKNRLLGYDCPCKPGMKGDGKTRTCKDVIPLVAKVVKRKTREFYERNGGPLLERTKMLKIFKKKDLKKTIKRRNLVGKGCFGEVYKGLLDNKPVLVKEPISGSVLENEKFADVVIIQSQVIHKNIIRLIGCCVEVDTPMLVYEFLINGNLEDILHNNKVVPLNMDVRLSIVAQLADGLAYMHSKTNSKILHGDIKPANILLGDNFMPKILLDLGILRLITRDFDELGKKATRSDNYSLVRSFLEPHKEEEKHLLHTLARIVVHCLDLNLDQRPSMIEVAEHLLALNQSRNL
ncbi:hypothetical protein BS78_08G013000 [Paspalum vaginatum]|nr:hypothetical protein BS78_08G013000 [Paspalum vaginatum]